MGAIQVGDVMTAKRAQKDPNKASPEDEVIKKLYMIRDTYMRRAPTEELCYF